ncbi:SpoIID/LytB domain-containing protein [Heliobacterium chlorum]|uniref:SpoIID/LytB domain-containing protein n=1 Tax=Heliobacterium chlorum TaxID=2698 RepID=A0ABR7T6M2_HELCL|nr:SpoIID/LytB domain-containing protein [Heliobacterium chlorum]MBC9785663.1 SpoIID/LytB domain-containing protein [Heliobacterium chlorum]
MAQTKRWGLHWLLMALFSLIITSGIVTPAEARELPLLRVLLAQQTSADVRVISGTYQWFDEETNGIIEDAGQKTWTASAVGAVINLAKDNKALAKSFNGPLLLKAVGSGENILEVNGKKYRGSLRVYHLRSQGTNSLALINVIDMESYLYGVVGMEIGSGAPEEAIKAQALASRTYALQQRDRRDSFGYYYDVQATQSSQVYQGIAGETPRVTQLVNATRGQVVTYDGKLIEAVFHSNSGGQTEDARYVWNSDVPYLRGVLAPEDKYAEEMKGSAALAYHWRKTITARQLANQTLSLTGKDPGDVKSLHIAEMSPSGRVTRLEVMGTKGTISIDKAKVRQLLDTPSTKFTISGSGASGADLQVLSYGSSGVTKTTVLTTGSYQLKSSGLAVLTATATAISSGGTSILAGSSSSADEFIIDGYGFGHGVGMSQWGAMGLAKAGKKYNDIIEHYYNQDRRDNRLRIVGDWGI